MTKEELLKTHPEYLYWIDTWQFYLRSYFGGRMYKDGNYLMKHPFESEENYSRRKEIAYFYNYCAPVVDIFVSHLYKNDAVRDYGSWTKDKLFDAFYNDADLEKHTFRQFMRDAQRFASIYGRVSIIVDKPNLTVRTMAEAQDNDIRPYLALITPENLLDWQYDRLPNGKLELSMVKVREGGSPTYMTHVPGTLQNNWKNADSMAAKPTVQTLRPGKYRIWTRNDWELHVVDDKGSIIETRKGTHGLGVVPMVTLYNRRSGVPMIGLSDIQDIADVNKNIYYLCSDAKEIIENTAFPMLALPYENASATGEDKPVGPKNIQQFDPDKPGAVPFWLEAPHSSLAEIREWIQQDIKEIYRIAKIGGIRTTQDTVQPSSGIALEIENQQLYAGLAEKADNCEQAESMILALWGKWEGKVFDGKIDYPDDFSIRDITIDLQNAIQVQGINIGSTLFKRELQKKIVTAVLPKIEEEVRDNIFAEIDKANPDTNADTGNGGGN